MIPIPNWATEAIHTTACIPCDHVYRDADVTGIGMRHVGDGKVCLCVEVMCPRCHRYELLAIQKRPTDIRAFIAELAELGGIEEYRNWAFENATLRFYPEQAKDRLTSTHHLHTDGDGWSDPRYTELRLCSSLTPCGVTIRVARMGTRVPEARVEALGGYVGDGGKIIILYRFGTSKIAVHDGLLLLGPKLRLRLLGFIEDRLEPSDWSKFGTLGSHQQFRLNGRVWQKMSLEDIRVAVGTDLWTVVKPRSCR